MSNDSGERSPAPFGFSYMAPLVLGATLNPINSTMISTAIVPIADSLHASIAEAGWLIAVLYLTSAIAQPTMGRLVDLFAPGVSFSFPFSLSRRRVFSGDWHRR